MQDRSSHTQCTYSTVLKHLIKKTVLLLVIILGLGIALCYLIDCLCSLASPVMAPVLLGSHQKKILHASEFAALILPRHQKGWDLPYLLDSFSIPDKSKEASENRSLIIMSGNQRRGNWGIIKKNRGIGRMSWDAACVSCCLRAKRLHLVKQKLPPDKAQSWRMFKTAV